MKLLKNSWKNSHGGEKTQRKKRKVKGQNCPHLRQNKKKIRVKNQKNRGKKTEREKMPIILIHAHGTHDHAPWCPSLGREPSEEISGHAPLRVLHVLIRRHRFPAEGAVEVEVIEPTVEAILVEHVTAS